MRTRPVHPKQTGEDACPTIQNQQLASRVGQASRPVGALPVRPVLLIALGNPLMGDEGIGWHIAERLRDDPRLPADVEVISGGTDLLRCADRLVGRRHIVVVDALLDHERPGTVVVASDCFEDFDSRQGHAHCLSAVQAIELLRAVTPGLNSARFTLAAVGIASVAIRPGLSAALAARLPRILDDVLRGIVETAEGGNGLCAWPCPAES